LSRRPEREGFSFDVLGDWWTCSPYCENIGRQPQVNRRPRRAAFTFQQHDKPNRLQNSCEREGLAARCVLQVPPNSTAPRQGEHNMLNFKNLYRCRMVLSWRPVRRHSARQQTCNGRWDQSAAVTTVGLPTRTTTTPRLLTTRLRRSTCHACLPAACTRGDLPPEPCTCRRRSFRSVWMPPGFGYRHGYRGRDHDHDRWDDRRDWRGVSAMTDTATTLGIVDASCGLTGRRGGGPP